MGPDSIWIRIQKIKWVLVAHLIVLYIFNNILLRKKATSAILEGKINVC